MKRKLEDMTPNPEFKFWSIVISRLVRDKSGSEVAAKFSCSESYVTQVMKKFENDGGYLDNRQFNGGHNKKAKETVEDQIVTEYSRQPGSTSTSISIKLAD